VIAQTLHGVFGRTNSWQDHAICRANSGGVLCERRSTPLALKCKQQ
jgi:hypothetical protein